MNLCRNIISLKAITSKEILRILRIWPQTIIPPIITNGLYLMIFAGILFRDKMISISGINIQYGEYLIPGLMMMSIIMNSYNNPASSFFTSKLFKNMEELLLSPTPISIIIIGFILGGVFRGLVNGATILLVVNFFFTIKISHILTGIFFAVFTATFFSMAGIINAIYAKSFDDISWFPAFILTPMVYLGGVFFSVDMLPQYAQSFTLINPVYHFVNGFRYSILGIGDFSPYNFFVIISANIFLFIFSVIIFKNKMKK